MTQKRQVAAKKRAKRKHTRFKPDPGAVALILTDDEGHRLETPVTGLICEESFAGCSLIVIKNQQFYEDSEFEVKVGNMDPIMATVRWMKSYDDKVSLMGLSYIDSKIS